MNDWLAGEDTTSHTPGREISANHIPVQSTDSIWPPLATYTQAKKTKVFALRPDLN